MRIYRYRSGGYAAAIAGRRSGRVTPPVDVSLDGRTVVDVPSSWTANPGSVSGCREGGPLVTRRFIEGRFLGAGTEPSQELQSQSHIAWLESRTWILCPLDKCASLRDFLAFEDHVKRGAARRQGQVPEYWYEAPVYYKGNHRSLIGPDEVCPWPRYTERLDFELELAMIVGVKGRDVTARGPRATSSDSPSSTTSRRATFKCAR